MLCPIDNKSETQVIDTRDDGRVIRRRRECLRCGFRFSTSEQLELPRLTVVKKDGKKEPFLKEKIKIGIQKACEKRPVCTSKIESIVDRIMAKIYSLGKREIETKKIGQIVINELRGLDSVAYIRFASVYRAFKSPKSFEKEAKKLTTKE